MGAQFEKRVALLPGDGIGPEVVREVTRLLDAVGRLDASVTLSLESFPWNAEHYLATGSMVPPDGLSRLAAFDAIFLGAIGDPRVPDHVALRQLIFAIRQGFNQYVNLRPVKLFDGVRSPLAGRHPNDINMVFVRENSEGEYAGVGGVLFPGGPDEVALQTAVFSRRGVERVQRYAFDLARRSGRRLTSVSKGNALNYSGVFWDRVLRRALCGIHRRRGVDPAGRRCLPAPCPRSRSLRCRRRLEPVRRHPHGPWRGTGRRTRARRQRQSQPRTALPLDVRAGARFGP